MGLNEFVKREEVMLKAFVELWKRNRKDHPDYYPEEMELDSWIEQMKAFRELIVK